MRVLPNVNTKHNEWMLSLRCLVNDWRFGVCVLTHPTCGQDTQHCGGVGQVHAG